MSAANVTWASNDLSDMIDMVLNGETMTITMKVEAPL